MTAEQIRGAVLNHKRPPRTHAGKVRDALAHVRQSRNNKTAEAVSLSPVAGHHNLWGECYG